MKNGETQNSSFEFSHYKNCKKHDIIIQLFAFLFIIFYYQISVLPLKLFMFIAINSVISILIAIIYTAEFICIDI